MRKKVVALSRSPRNGYLAAKFREQVEASYYSTAKVKEPVDVMIVKVTDGGDSGLERK